MTSSPLADLIDYLRREHPRSARGVDEARSMEPQAFDLYGDRFVGWAVAALGADAIPRIGGAFSQFSSDVNLAQARYEADGHYENKSYAECYESVYGDRETMDDYLWGVYLTNFLWAHHMELSLFYQRRFLDRLEPGSKLVEVAPGHGGWGLWALHDVPGTTLRGFDISPSSTVIARSLAEAAGLADRARYELRDALALTAGGGEEADACICCFLVEHLEEPDKLLEALAAQVRPRGRVFFTGALTAAQVDHIYEFRRESELADLAERHGFRVLETLSVGPARTLPRARFLPRSMALVLQKRHREVW